MALTEAQEITVSQANDVLRREYYDAVREIAAEAEEMVKKGEIEDEDGLTEWVEQSVDGSQWIIYTRRNFQVLQYSDNDSAYVEQLGEVPVTDATDINWAALAYMAMLTDVREHLTDWDDMEKPGEDEDSE